MSVLTIQEPKNTIESLQFINGQLRRISLTANGNTQVVCDELAERIKAFGLEDFDENSGLYLGTSDAGIGSSVTFWKEALEHGPGLVGPRLFPFTLANSPASCLARLLNIKGPSVTLVGGEELLLALHEMAIDDLNKQRVDKALIVYLKLEEGEAWVLVKK